MPTGLTPDFLRKCFSESSYTSNEHFSGIWTYSGQLALPTYVRKRYTYFTTITGRFSYLPVNHARWMTDEHMMSPQPTVIFKLVTCLCF